MNLAPDVAAAVEHLRRERGLDMNEAVNELIRRGLFAKAPRTAFRQRTYDLGLRVDVSDVAGTISLLDGPGTI